MNNDLISRRAAIEALGEQPLAWEQGEYEDGLIAKWESDVEAIKNLPPAQPAQHIDADGTLWITVPDIKQVKRVIVDEDKSKFCRQFYMDAQPEPCEDAVSRAEVLRMIDCINDHQDITPYKSVGAVTEHLTRIASSLQPVTPKQRTGKWIKKHRHYGGFRSYTWFDAMGEQHTVTVDERTEYDDLYCSECGARSADNFLNFCPNCGVKMEVVVE